MEGFGSRGNHRSRGGTPGGGSSIVFGDEGTAPVKQLNPVAEEGDLAGLKLRAIQDIVNAQDAGEVETALRTALQKLTTGESDATASDGFPAGNGQVVGGMEGASRAPDGAPATAKGEEALARLKLALRGRGCNGIVSLGVRFRVMDDNGNKQLSYQEFKKGMEEIGIAEEDTKELFRFFDKDLSGSINFDELLEGLAPPPNPRRRALIMQAFKVFDKDGSGEVTVQDLMQRYDPSQHPDVGSGKTSSAQALRELLDAFDEGEKDGVVTTDEFLRYYQRVGASIDDDDYFELMIRNAWHMSGGEGWCANTTCRRVLVTHADGHQTVEEITNDMDIGRHDNAAMMANLKARGIDAIAIAVTGAPTESTTAQPSAATSPTPRSARGRGQAFLQSSIQF